VIADYAILAVISFATTLISTYFIMVIERKYGILSVDVHKPNKPLIPKIGGIALLINYALMASILVLLKALRFTQYPTILIPYIASVIISGILGLIDDLRGISPILKILLFMLPGLPIVLLHAYNPRPYVPLIGTLRLTIIYPLLILVLYTVLSNAFNMADTHNGTIFIISFSLIAVVGATTLMMGPKPLTGFYLFLTLSLASLIAYAPFNMYPARIFNGNCGSHMIGALMASLIVMSRREFAALMALTPLVLNGFSILVSIKGLKSKESIIRPVITDEKGIMRANRSSKAPITLVQLLTIKQGLTELEVIKSYTIIMIFTALISIALYYILNLLFIL